MTGQLCLALAGLLISSACRDEKQESTPLSTAPAAKSSAPAASTAQEPKPWYFGVWRGNYHAEKLNPLEDENYGQQMAWIRDKGERFVGTGSIEVRVDEAGRASGEAQGPLGQATLQGRVDGHGAFLRMKPLQDDSEAFAGMFKGKKQGTSLMLQLRAASGDGDWVRAGQAELKREAPP